MGRRPNPQAAIRRKIALEDDLGSTCDKAVAGAAVMLHLRLCYVSKAAILTVPVQVVLTENRSPA
jgi:hypothetical protein